MRALASSGIALACLVALACADAPAGQRVEPDPPSGPLLDAAGRAFDANDPPDRIVSLVPSASEVLVALGQRARLVGRTEFDTAAVMAELPSVGGGLEPSVESLVALEPDVVIRFLGQADRRTPAQMDALGIPHFAVHPERVDDIREMVRDLGQLTDAIDEADSLLWTIDEGLAAVRRRVAGRAPPLVAFLLDGTPAWAAGPETFVSELISIAGGRNVFDDLTRPWAPVSAEELVARPMDMVLTPAGSSPAGVPPTVPIVPVSALAQLPGPRIHLAAEELARTLHPERFR